MNREMAASVGKLVSSSTPDPDKQRGAFGPR
jgi:hypothetical protein